MKKMLLRSDKHGKIAFVNIAHKDYQPDPDFGNVAFDVRLSLSFSTTFDTIFLHLYKFDKFSNWANLSPPNTNTGCDEEDPRGAP